MNTISMKGAVSRRQFVAASLSAIAATGLAGKANAVAQGDIYITRSAQPTIAEVIEMIIKAIPRDPSLATVDTVKCGNTAQPLTGIVTTMFPTVDVIRKAVELKANLIIAHEPSFYNHMDDTSWLAGHEVYVKKRALLDSNGIVIWRFHDYIHANRPDGVLMGVLEALGWEKYYDEGNPKIVTLPGLKLGDIIKTARRAMGIEQVRYIGDLNERCSRVAVLPGAWGGRNHMQVLDQEKPDLLICGELQEWETSEYVRDARALGLRRALLVLGHSVSEEPGMRWTVGWLAPKLPGVPVKHVASGNPLLFA